jgi:hypothetical protein
VASLPLLVNELLDFLKKEPGLIIFALVVVIGIIQGVARGVKKLLDATGLRDGGGQDGRGGLAAADRGRTGSARRDPVLDADPESLLPAMMRSRGYQEPEPDPEPAGVRLAPPEARPPKARSAMEQPRVTRRQREQARAAAAPVHDDHQALLEGPLAVGRAGTTETTHDHDVTMARRLVRGRRPTRREVRTAVLWREILGPPRAIEPYQSPARRGLRNAAGNPSAIAIMPLRDRPKS